MERVLLAGKVAVLLACVCYDRKGGKTRDNHASVCGLGARMQGLFAPPEQISAASMLETLYFYAIAHQNDFDVCWCKGTIAERIFQPLIQRIEGAGGKVVGNRLVTGLATNDAGDVTQVRRAHQNSS
eukprot:355993-Chlamydomonas_euryale.AAC.11